MSLMFGTVWILTLLVCFLLFLAGEFETLDKYLSESLSDSFLIASILAIYLPIYAKFSYYEINEEGLVTSRVFKKFKTLRWADMITATGFPKKIESFMPYVVIFSRKWYQKSHWLPLWVDRPKEFRQAVLECAPEGNPLREYFARR